MFESLTDKLLATLRTLGGKTKLDEALVDEICRQLRTSLIEADVNVKVVKDFVEAVRVKAMSAQTKRTFSPEQDVIRIIYKELATLMGEAAVKINLAARPPAVVMLVGLQGSGKTTTSIKLARYLRDQLKRSVMTASIDIYRPAAIEQLRILSLEEKIEHFDNPTMDSARTRAILAKEEAIRRHADTLILDTAGRLHIDDDMMEELRDVVDELEPSEILLVLDSMTGQEAVNVATQFQERIPVSGIVLTKLDGDARGGAALSVRAVTGCPIKFMGVGEKAQDLELFYPDRMASRILDMGDLLSLAEKATDTIDSETAKKLTKKVKKNDFNLADFQTHLQQIKKMGSFENLIKFLPGMGQVSKQLKNMAPPEAELKRIEAIILSMTQSEREDPNLLDGSRRKRIASGSGTKVEDVNRLMKQFMEARKMMTRMTKMGMGKRPRLW